jgi:cell division protein FtsB
MAPSIREDGRSGSADEANVRMIMAIMGILLLALQYKAWFGDAGFLKASALEAEVDSQRSRTEELAQRNRLLTGEVLALKAGYAAVEARARSDLGMIKQGETFYLITDDE